MSKIKWKKYLYSGIISATLLPFCTAFFSAILFPDRFKGIFLLIFVYLICLAVVLFTFAFARFRMESGRTNAKNLLRALSPAQICLIAGASLFWVGFTILAFRKTVGNTVVGFSSLLMTVSAFIAFLQGLLEESLSGLRRTDRNEAV